MIAIVIGAGIGGIATALRLKAKGFAIEVFEAGNDVGGKLGELKIDGYRWDTGPSLFTMPQLVDELFELHSENPRDYFNYKTQDSICHYFWQDGTEFIAPQNIKSFVKKAGKKFNENEEAIENYLIDSAKKYELTAPLFLDRSLHKLSTYSTKETLDAISQIGKLNIGGSLNDLNEKTFNNPKLIQLFNRFATYNGSSPFKTSGIMSMIPSLEMQQGTFFPKGGMRSIAESLKKLAIKKGIQFHFNEKVQSIKIKDKKAVGVESKRGLTPADVIISNMDIYPTYRQLLPTVKAPERTLKAERSSSGVIFYWGIKKTFPKLGLHNIFFSDNYKEEFEEIFEKKRIPKDPTIYINISAKEKESDAPIGCENWFVMVNAPANSGQDWESLVNDLRKMVLMKLSSILNVDLAQLIETETILDPIKIEENTSSHQGALYGTSSNSKFSAFLRHPNFSSKVNQLYFCGGSVHPGGGIPLCLKSAKIVADLISKA